MPSPYTPAATFMPFGADAAPIPVPDSQQSLPVEWKRVVDALRATRGPVLGGLVGSAEVYTSSPVSGAAGTATGIYVGAMSSVAVADSSGIVHGFADVPLTELHVGTHFHATNPLAANTAYYIYLRWNSSSSTYEFRISTQYPGASGVWIEGTPYQYRFVGTFITEGTGTPVPFYTHRGETTLLEDDAALTTVYTGRPNGTAQAVTLAGYPTVMSLVRLRASISSDGADDYLQVYRSGSAAAVAAGRILKVSTAPAGGTAWAEPEFWFPVEPTLPTSGEPLFGTAASNRKFVLNGLVNSTSNADVYVTGWKIRG